MSRFWGQNLVIDGSRIKEQFEDPISLMLPPGQDPLLVTNETSNPGAAQYETATQDVMRQIAHTQVGAILVQRINAQTQRTLTIRPLNQKALGLTGAIWANPVNAKLLGVGSDVTIWFDPGTWGSAAAKAVDSANHFRADDVLFHELVHAVRGMRGLIETDPIVRWDTIEDLIAIMLTNIYLSSNNRNGDMRGDHGRIFHELPHSLLRPAERESDQAFYLQNSTYIDKLCQKMPDLCGPISAIQCSWNPLAARLAYQSAVSRMFT